LLIGGGSHFDFGKPLLQLRVLRMERHSGEKQRSDGGNYRECDCGRLRTMREFGLHVAPLPSNGGYSADQCLSG
jgi:hypothetical protein